MFLRGICAPLQAQEIDGVSVRNVTMDRNGAYMAVDMDVDLSALEVDGNRAVLFTPRIANGADTLSLAFTAAAVTSIIYVTVRACSRVKARCPTGPR